MSYIYTLAQAADAAPAAAPAPAADATQGIVSVPAQSTGEQAAAAQTQKPEGGFLDQLGILPMLLIFFVLIYFLIIRPQKKQQKELKDRQDSLKPGDKVVSAGGIFGIVREVKEQTIKMEIAPNTVIKIAKSSIVQNVAKDGTAEEKK